MKSGDSVGDEEDATAISIEDQLNELLALRSIFAGTTDSIEYEVGANGAVRVSGEILVSFPKCDTVVVTVRLDATNQDVGNATVSYLPPLSLKFEFPTDYPSISPPNFTIRSVWLNKAKQLMLTKRLLDIWDSYCGMPILYLWIEAVKDEVLTNMISDKMIEITIEDALENKYSKSDDILKSIIEYDEQMQQNEFDNKWYDCEVCFDSKVGRDSIQFLPCHHVFCLNCVSGYYRQQLSDNMIRQLQCLNVGCESSAAQKQIQRIFTAQEYELYEKRLLEGTLDLMNDVVTCPRRSCQAPVIVDDSKDDKTCGLASCSVCHYSFCISCQKTYHGIEPCTLDPKLHEKIFQEYENADAARREQICRKFGGKKQFENYLEAMQSDQWMDDNSKACPSCRTKIEKRGGCNKVKCVKCGCDFCWLCRSVLSNVDPYKHFNEPGASHCYELLFEGMEDDEEEFRDFGIFE